MELSHPPLGPRYPTSPLDVSKGEGSFVLTRSLRLTSAVSNHEGIGSPDAEGRRDPCPLPLPPFAPMVPRSEDAPSAFEGRVFPAPPVFCVPLATSDADPCGVSSHEPVPHLNPRGPLSRGFEGSPGGDDSWGSLTCSRIEEMFEAVRDVVREGQEGGRGLAFDKLTHNYWRRYIREETLRAIGEPSMVPSCRPAMGKDGRRERTGYPREMSACFLFPPYVRLQMGVFCLYFPSFLSQFLSFLATEWHP